MTDTVVRPTDKRAGVNDIPSLRDTRAEAEWLLPSGQDLISFALATGLGMGSILSPADQDSAAQGGASARNRAAHGQEPATAPIAAGARTKVQEA